MPKLMKKFKINFIDLVRPETFSYFGMLDTEKAMLVYQWMVAQSERYTGVLEMLSDKPTCVNLMSVESFGLDWKKDLAKRYQCVFLSNIVTPGAQAWRTEHEVDLNSSRMIHVPYYGPERPEWLGNVTTERFLTDLLSTTGTLIHQYNPYHPQARAVKAVRLQVRPEFRLILRYGYPDEKHWSYWSYILATQDKGEPFLDFLKRGQEILVSELEPAEQVTASGAVPEQEVQQPEN